jgi:cold shock protein
MLIGTLVNIEPGRRFAFIAPDSGGRNIFVHMDALLGAGMTEPVLGVRLNFEIEADPAGRPRATALKLIERPAPDGRYETRMLSPRQRP